MFPSPAIYGHRGGVEVIADGGSTFTVIDWRDGGATWPHADLGQFLFGVKAWKGGWHEDLLSPLLDGYLGGEPPDAEGTHALYLEGLSRTEWTRPLIGIAEAAIRMARGKVA